jgi:hypothetical protein
MSRSLAFVPSVVLLAGVCAAFTACSTVAREWPVRHITLPAGAVEAKLPPAFADAPQGGSSENVRDGWWFRCFDCPGGWGAVVEHLEECIEPLGYSYSEFETMNLAPPQTDPNGLMRVYASRSGQVKVTAMHLSACAPHGPGLGGGGEYLILVATDLPGKK